MEETNADDADKGDFDRKYHIQISYKNKFYFVKQWLVLLLLVSHLLMEVLFPQYGFILTIDNQNSTLDFFLTMLDKNDNGSKDKLLHNANCVLAILNEHTILLAIKIYVDKEQEPSVPLILYYCRYPVGANAPPNYF